jgi:hypothetical protein
MTDTVPGANLRRDRIIAWITVILSLVALLASSPKNPLVLLLLFFSLLGGLVWILVIGFQLRRADVAPTHKEALFWRVVYLWVFSALNIYLCFYYGLSNWKTWWGSLLMAILGTSSAILLWRGSSRAKFPLYAVTLCLGLGALGGGIYNYMENPALLQDPIQKQIISWLIPGIPTALLINCCLYARRMVRAKVLGCQRVSET